MENKDLFLKKYLSQGYVFSDNLLNSYEIDQLRLELDKEFENYYTSHKKKLLEFKNIKLIKKILKIYKSSYILEVQKNLKKITNESVSLLPSFEVHKNYHVNLKEVHGWHRDCGGELEYNYCKKILYKENYLFSKVGIYLQENNSYGGSIDIVKNTHKNFRYDTTILRKLRSLPLKIVTTLHKYFRKLYLKVPERFFLHIIGAKKLSPTKGSAVFFDSRIIHRGSPIEKRNLKDAKFYNYYHAVLPKKEFDKYSLYCHFGSANAIDSYMYDRLNRNENSLELKNWFDEINFISKFEPDFANEMKLVMGPIKKKYNQFI